jgi:O-antigen chain-terminating methyltransferase
LLRTLTDQHPVDGWIGEYDEQMLEHGLNVKAELNASVEEKAQLRLALGSQVAESERLQAELSAQVERPQADLNAQVERLQAELSAQVQEKIALRAALERSQMQVKATLASTSWRLTAPLRAGGNFFRALRFFRQGQ